jgi:hypothetical protein
MSVTIQYKYYCEKCNYGTNFKYSMQEHETSTLHKTGHRKSKKVIEIYKCDNCEYENEHKYNYIAHKLNNHGTKEERKEQFKYYCDVCDMGTFSKSVHEIHVNSIRHKRNSETHN